MEQFDGENGPVLPLAYWPELEESDQWEEWMGGGTWVAREGEDYTSPTDFQEEVRRKAEEANLGVRVRLWEASFVGKGWSTTTVAFRFRARSGVLDFSKPMPAHDEETGEYLGYWWVDGKRVEAPDDTSAPVI
ncbi:hypothetical protein ACQEV4_40245 [Streptomyces shenzhenensis]|uniref:hypothetical protein n=1 Tax=Streptomyces shenzhenensis TaxID=943815 RepID=UPI003D930DE1